MFLQIVHGKNGVHGDYALSRVGTELSSGIGGLIILLWKMANLVKVQICKVSHAQQTVLVNL